MDTLSIVFSATIALIGGYLFPLAFGQDLGPARLAVIRMKDSESWLL